MKKKSLLLTAVALMCITTATMGQNVPSYVPTNGLIGWWPFNGNANDESGNGYNGSVTGSTLTKDRFGMSNNAYNFLPNNFIEVQGSASINFTDSLSINCWYKNNIISGGVYVSKHISSTLNSSFVMYNEPTNGCGPTNYITDVNNQIRFIKNGSLCDTISWHMLTLVFKKPILKMYTDGVLYDSITCNTIKQANLPILFGATSTTSPPFAASVTNSKIDDIGIWNRGLSQQDINSLFSASGSSSSLCFPTYINPNGLVGWWPFCGNANDESGNGHNGVVFGANLSEDRFGIMNSSYRFDGINDKILIPNHPQFNMSSYTISAWVKKMGQGPLNKDHYSIVAKNNTTYRYNDPFHITHTKLNATSPFQPNQLLISHGGGGISSYIDQYPNFTLTDSSWVNIVVTYDSSIDSIKTYINGIMYSSNYVPFNNVNNTDPITIGEWDFYDNNFNGFIDDIGIWNRAINPQEVSNLYNGNLCFQTITVTDTLLINMGITGFNPVTYNNTIKIYPNPTNDHITIDNGDYTSLNGYQIIVSNTLGQQVFQSAITQQSFYVDITTWGGAGVYFVNIINPNGVTTDTRKIVLQ